MNDYKSGELLPNGTYYLGMLPDGTHSAMEKTKIKPDTWDNLNKKYVLPNQYEGLMLYELYQQKPELFDLGDSTVIWLSVPDGASLARVQDLDGGYQVNFDRDDDYSSCPVRRFKSLNDLIISDEETVLSALKEIRDLLKCGAMKQPTGEK